MFVGRFPVRLRDLFPELLEDHRGDDVGRAVAIDVRDRRPADETPLAVRRPDRTGKLRALGLRAAGAVVSGDVIPEHRAVLAREGEERRLLLTTTSTSRVPSPSRSIAGSTTAKFQRLGPIQRSHRDGSRPGSCGLVGFAASQTTLPVAPSRRIEGLAGELDDVGLAGRQLEGHGHRGRRASALPGACPPPGLRTGCHPSPSRRPSSSESLWAIVSPRLTAKR